MEGRLKEVRPWTGVQTERMILQIMARGLLTKRQSQIAWAIISDSWAHFRKKEPPGLSNRTRSPMTLGVLQRLTGLPKTHAGRELREMLDRGMVCPCSDIRDRQIRLSFNEHWTTWGVAENVTRGVTESVTMTENVTPPRVTESVTGGLPNPSPFETESVTERLCYNKSARARFSHSTHKKNHSSSTATKRTRLPTEAESVFIAGFERMYGHKPVITKNPAIKLAQRVGTDGIEIVRRKIELWWESPAGRWVDGARTIGAFLHSYDDIIASGDRQPGGSTQPDLSRFDRATRPAG